MSSHVWRLAGLVGVSAVLFLWPFLSPESATKWLADRLSMGSFVTLWGASSFAGVLIALNAVLSHLQSGGRAAIAGQPTLGLAAKPWGVLAPGVWMLPVLLLLIVAFAIGWKAGIGGPLVVPALLVCLILVGYYVRILWSIDRRRRVLRRRSVASTLDERPSENFTRAELEGAFGVIAAVARVPPGKLRWTDRFGFDIGTFSSLDETLDRLGGRLLIEQNKARRPLVLENIRTAGDYVREWIACTRARERP